MLTSHEPVEEEKEKKSYGTLFSAQGPHPNLQPCRFVSLAEKKNKVQVLSSPSCSGSFKPIRRAPMQQLS